MLSQLLFHERRRINILLQTNDRRNGERRQWVEAYSPERRRPASRIRCQERQGIVLPIRLQIEGKDRVGHMVNISPGGVMIGTNTPLREGLEVFLHLFLEQDAFSLRLFGRIVFCRSLEERGPLSQAVGIQFRTSGEFNQKVLAATIDLIRKKDATEDQFGISILISDERHLVEKQPGALPMLPLISKAITQIREMPINQITSPETRRTMVGGRRKKQELRFTPDPDWVIKMNQALEPYRQVILQSRLVQETSKGQLSLKQIRGWNIQFYPFIHSVPHFIALNLARANDPMSRTYLIDNIRVEKRHADQWVDMAQGFGVSTEELFQSPILAEVEALTHWMWSVTTRASFIESVAALHYAIEGITQEIAAIMVKELNKYKLFEWVHLDRKACQWMEMHTRYDHRHPYKALEIIKLYAVSLKDQEKVKEATQRSLEYLFLALEACYVAFA